jgi:hypothetical protein
VNVFDVGRIGQEPEGLKFFWGGVTVRDRVAMGAWYAPPIGILPGDGVRDWVFAWTIGPGIDLLSGLPGQALSERPSLLLAGMENVYRIEFSRDSRFLFAQSYAGFGRVYARVWDLTRAWDATISKAIDQPASLRDLVCHVAGIEPDGDRFTTNELKTEIGEQWSQPCPAPPPSPPIERSHPF